VKQITADTMDTFPTNEDHGIVDRVARDRAPQAKRWWAKSSWRSPVAVKKRAI